MITLVKIVGYQPAPKRCRDCGSYEVEWKAVGANAYYCRASTMTCPGCEQRVVKGLGGYCDDCAYSMAEGAGRTG